MNRSPLISSSPQIHVPMSTPLTMALVLIALLPAGLWSVLNFGWRSVLVTLTAAAAAVAAEGLLNLIFKRPQSIGDLSALVTGVLVGYNMPPSVPLFIPILAALFAISIVKWSFGGLGANWMNPALAGRLFAFFSWSGPMTSWTPSRFSPWDGLTGATPLGAVKTAEFDGSVSGPLDLLESMNLPFDYGDFFLGRIPGSIGEVSALMLLLGGLFLLLTRVIDWDIPLSYLGSFALFVWVFDGLQYDRGLFSGDPLFHILAGGLMLGVWFMATDLVTTPLRRGGRIVFGLGCGFFTFLIRSYGSLPEGVSLAILFMNIFVPLIDRFMVPRRYGVKEKA